MLSFNRDRGVYNMVIKVNKSQLQCKRALGPCVQCNGKGCVRYPRRGWYAGHRDAAFG